MKKLSLLLILFLITVQISYSQISISSARQQSIGSTVTIRGIVTNGPELGVIRYLQDGTAGIAAYSSSLSAVDIGDSIEVTGVLKSYNGLLEIDPVTSHTIISSGNPLPAPKIITLSSGFAEAYEGQLVQVNAVQFTNSGNFSTSSANYDITNGSVTKEVRILSSTNIGGAPIPSGNIDIVGLMGEYFGTYQLQPRSLSDLQAAGPKFTTSLDQKNITTTGFTVDFETANNGNTIVKYGTTPSMTSVVSDNSQVTNHSINISGLSPATIYYVQALSINSSNDTSFSGMQRMATASLSLGEMKAYFNRSVDISASTGVNAVHLNNTFPDTIIAYINRAKQTLDIAIYNIDNDHGIISAINAAANNGIQVRLITNESINSTNYNLISVPKKKSPSGPAPSGGYYGLMHNKFMIIDAESSDPNDPIIITGSTNFTNQQLLNDANNLVIVQDQSLARAYQIEFQEMWSNKFGPEKTANTPTQFNIGGNLVELYFSPTDNPEENLKKTILSADTDIHFNIYTWTRYNIAYDMRDRYNAGVFVAGVVDDTSNGGGQAFTIIDDATPATILLYNQSGILHHKYLMSDATNPSSDPQILTGSYNWSSNGATRSDENYLIIHDDTMTNIFYQEWRQRYFDNGGTVTLGITDAASGSTVEFFSSYPNPVKHTLFLPYSIEKAEDLHVEIYSISGSRMYTYHTSSPKGKSLLNIPVAELQSGIYFLKVTCGDYIYTQKFIKI